MQATIPGWFATSRPTFSGWKPSTSFAGSIRSSTSLKLSPAGSGDCTRIPSTRSSAFIRSTISSTSRWLDVAGIGSWNDSMPASRHAAILLRT